MAVVRSFSELLGKIGDLGVCCATRVQYRLAIKADREFEKEQWQVSALAGLSTRRR